MPRQGYARSWFNGRSDPVHFGVALFKPRRDRLEEEESLSLEDGHIPSIPVGESGRRRRRYTRHNGRVHHTGGRARGQCGMYITPCDVVVSPCVKRSDNEYISEDGDYGIEYETGYLEQELPRQTYPWERRDPWCDFGYEFAYAGGRFPSEARNDYAHVFESGRSSSHRGRHHRGGRRRHHHNTFNGYAGSSDHPDEEDPADDYEFDYHTSEHDWIPEYLNHGGGRRRHHTHPQRDTPRGSRRGWGHGPEYEINDDNGSIPPHPDYDGRYGGSGNRRRRSSRRTTTGRPAGFGHGNIRLEDGTIVPNNCYELVRGTPAMDQDE